jgi:hypothetical protein
MGLKPEAARAAKPMIFVKTLNELALGPRALLPGTDSSSGRVEGLTLAISVRRIENVETTLFDIPHF